MNIIVGKTDLWTVRPEIAALLTDPSDGYKYGKGSDAKRDFTCPCCGVICKKRIANVCNRGFSCDYCSDGISYPNKFARALLNQLPVQNIDYEWNPEWLKPYKYDCYFEYNDCKYVLEMDGGVGHGHRKYKSTEVDCSGQERDWTKDKLARQYNINVIRIDCNYGDNCKRFSFIKNSTLDSALSLIFNLSDIDWEKCNAASCTSFVVQASLLYESGMAQREIMEQLKCSKSAVLTWLKQGRELNLCSYTPEEMRRRGNTQHLKCVNQYTDNGMFVRNFYSISEASVQTGIGETSIVHCCRKRLKTAGGFLWFYASDPTQPDKTKIIPTTQN